MRKTREVLMEEDKEMPESADPSPSDSETSNLKLDLERAMQGLSDAERSAIVQCYYNDLTHEEAAYVLGIPLGTV